MARSSASHGRGRHPSAVTPRAGRFAHPSEEVFAALLNLYGLSWTYEPIEFPLAWNERGEPTRAFRPDFYVASRDLFIELTVLEQRHVTRKNQKIREFRTLYPQVDLLVVYQRDFTRLLTSHALGTLSDFAA
jgi:bifunctional protein TilS/HprT